MKIFKILILIITMTAVSLQAKIAVFDASSFIIKNDKSSLIQSDFNRYDFEIVKSDASKIFNQNNRQIKITNFPIRPDYSVTLNLVKQNSVIPKDAEIRRYGKDGKVKLMPIPNNPKYYGTIEGSKNSDVFFTYSSLGLVGYIQDEMGQIYDVSSKLDELNKAKIPHSVSETTIGQMVNNKYINTCANDEYFIDDPSKFDIQEEKMQNTTQKSDLIEIKMAADANFEFYLKFCQFITGKNKNEWLDGESWFFDMTEAELNQAYTNSVDYIENIISGVDRIYNREVGLIFKLKYISIFDNPETDPYFNELFGALLQDKLQAMSEIWNLRQDEAQDRTLATLFSDVERQPGGNTLGIANSGDSYKGSICSKSAGYSALGMQGIVSFPRLSYSQDVQVTAHEFGHNFGCPHTHFCGWPQLTGEPIIDSCVAGNFAGDAECISISDRRTKLDGTIMSYCHIGGRIVLDFHPRMKKRIRKHTEQRLTQCITLPDYPVVRLISPLGDEKLFAGEETTIKFQAANVPQSKLLYSLDGGEEWTEIATVNTAEDTTYVWDVPDVTSDKTLVRIESTEDEEVFDQSVLLFNISQIAVKANFPKPNNEIGYLADHRIIWEKQNVNKVNVMFSLDGGENYKEIILESTNNSIVYNFPDEVSDNAILLIESVDDPSINVKVPFKLGREKVTFTNVKEGDTLNIDFVDFLLKFDTEFITDEFNLKFKHNDDPEVLITPFGNKVDLETNTFKWVFGDDIKAGDRGILNAEIITPNESEVVGSTVGEFYFDALTDVRRQYYDGFTINNISPNPTTNSFTIEIKNIQPKLIRTNIYIISEDGKISKTINNKFVVSGSSILDVDVSDLQSGTYFVMIESDKYKDVQQLKIER